jgi:peptide/nickel transport system permease protein
MSMAVGRDGKVGDGKVGGQCQMSTLSPASSANTSKDEPPKKNVGVTSTRALHNVVRARSGVWFRFRRHRLALVGSIIIALLAVIVAITPDLFALDPYTTDLKAYRKPPSAEHWLGTDSSGRDVLARLVYAGRVSLSVGIVAVSIYVVIGILLGAISGHYGKSVDNIIMRLADIVMAFPRLIIIITVAALVGPSIYNVMLIIGLLSWPPIARLVRGLFLSLRERDFVVAARCTGASDMRLMFRHQLPNAMAPLIVAATYGTAGAILTEASLSFLGLGVQPPTASWGNMLSEAQSISILETMPWLWLPPGLMITITVLSLNFIGDGLRDALDPYQVSDSK